MAMGDQAKNSAHAGRVPLIRWFASTPAFVALVLALACVLILLVLKPDWSPVFAGWWLIGMLMYRWLAGEAEIEIVSLASPAAATIALVVAFLVVALLAPQVLVLLGGLMAAALLAYAAFNWLRSQL